MPAAPAPSPLLTLKHQAHVRGNAALFAASLTLFILLMFPVTESRGQMGTPLVSIITPTFNRPNLLPQICKCVLWQTEADFEWLVLDDSPQPCEFMRTVTDRRIRYRHDTTRRTIGAKRNLLVEQAQGKIVAHFDDDDYYAHGYLSKMIAAMNERNADIVKLAGYFLFSKIYRTLGYWDLTVNVGPHMVWSPEPMEGFVVHNTGGVQIRDLSRAFGFSYVFKKEVWEFAKFADKNVGEDGAFVDKAVERFSLLGLQDDAYSCLHIVHKGSTSRCFPQYLLPAFMLDRLFPDVGEFLNQP